MIAARLGLLLAAVPGVCCVPAAARTLDVGAGQTYASPSEAAAAAADGDTVAIAPGSYYDCAMLARQRADHRRHRRQMFRSPTGPAPARPPSWSRAMT